jgi:hypothetical protein
MPAIHQQQCSAARRLEQGQPSLLLLLLPLLLEPERSAQLISITSSRAQLGCADVRECLCMQAQPCRQVPYNHHTSKNNTEKLPLLLPETPIQL